MITTQRNLFHPGVDAPMPGYAPGSDTSKVAAELVRPKVGKRQRLILDALDIAGRSGLTVSEMMHRLGLPCRNGCAPRCSELKALGLIVDSGRSRPALISQAQESVWLLPQYAREETTCE